MSTTITRADLAEAVYEQVGLSRNESSDLVEAVLDEISSTLVKGENVKISSFGSFSVREKGERIGRNPKTGVEVPIKPRKVIVFRASHVLKDRINIGTASLGAGPGSSMQSESFGSTLPSSESTGEQHTHSSDNAGYSSNEGSDSDHGFRRPDEGSDEY